MDVVRTPDERFADLPGWPYEPRYVAIGDGLRVHYVDEGPSDAPPVVLTHGEPTWSYLYRRMIPPLVDAGHRVVAFDLVGFGRSDKPVDRDEYTYGRHARWFTETVSAIGLADITMFCQDWGGLIGLVHLARHPERYRAVVAANTGIPPGTDVPMADDEPFPRWRRYAQEMDPFSASASVAGAASPLDQVDLVLSDGERRAYDAPFPDERHCAGARQFPLLVPLAEMHPGAPTARRAWELLSQVQVPVATLFGAADDVTGVMQPFLSSAIPGAAGQPHRTVDGAGHFIQEHAPDACVEMIQEMVERTR